MSDNAESVGFLRHKPEVIADLTYEAPPLPEHDHDAAGCLDCSCNAAPWSSRTPCTCVTPSASTPEEGS